MNAARRGRGPKRSRTADRVIPHPRYGLGLRTQRQGCRQLPPAPASEFTRRRPRRCGDRRESPAVSSKVRSPGKQILLTVSPVRHLGDGLEGKLRQQGALRPAAEELEAALPVRGLFSSLQILTDDLRDYRFYADDLIHPARRSSPVWEKFIPARSTTAAGCCSPKSSDRCRSRPFGPAIPRSEAHRAFCRRQLERICGTPGDRFSTRKRAFPAIYRNKFVNLPTNPSATMNKRLILLLIAALAALRPLRHNPRLIIQIVVGSMRAGDLDRYAANFGEGGFRLLTERGTVYTDARYDCLQTTTPCRWPPSQRGGHALDPRRDRVRAEWTHHKPHRGAHRRPTGPGFYHRIAPDAGRNPRARGLRKPVRDDRRRGHVGRRARRTRSEVFWLDSLRCDWVTSPLLRLRAPEWIARSNREALQPLLHRLEWRSLLRKRAATSTRASTTSPRGAKQEEDRDGLTAETHERLRTTALHPGGKLPSWGWPSRPSPSTASGPTPRPTC